MHRLAPDLLQQLWDLRMAGASLRKIAVVLGISRNTVRRHVRRATHGSGFPPPLDAAPPWRARAREIVDMHGPIMATILAATLRAEGYTVSARSVQRELACLRAERSTALDAAARADAFCAQWTQIERGDQEERRQVS